MINASSILTGNDFVLVPTVEKEIPYIWELLAQWKSGCLWKSMYKDYDEFFLDLSSRLTNKKDMLWTCWTKNGKASKKFGVILLSDICYGLSTEIHGIADKDIYKTMTRKSSLADKAFSKVLDFCFEGLGVARVNATFYKQDKLILALLKRHGFKRNAFLKKSVYINQEIFDTYIYGLLEEQHLNKGK